MFLETSQDILYITVSICAAFFTGFLCAVLYYLASLLKQSNQITTEFHTKAQEWMAAIDEVKDKVISAVTTVSALSDQVGRVVEFLTRRKQDDDERDEPRRKRK